MRYVRPLSEELLWSGGGGGGGGRREGKNGGGGGGGGGNSRGGRITGEKEEGIIFTSFQGGDESQIL